MKSSDETKMMNQAYRESMESIKARRSRISTLKLHLASGIFPILPEDIRFLIDEADKGLQLEELSWFPK